MIAAGWDIMNHSFYHDSKGNFNYGSDAVRNTIEVTALILDK